MSIKKKRNPNYRNIFSAWLEKGEVIKYAEHQKFSPIPNYVPFVVLLLGITLLLFNIDLGIIVIIIGSILLIANIYSLFYEKGIAITSRKIIILGRKGRPEFIFYNKIFDVSIIDYEKDKKVFINQAPHIPSQIIEPGTSLRPFNTNVQRLGNIIRRVWKRQSPYVLFNKRMKPFAIEKKLKITPLDLKRENEFELSGIINGLVFNLSLKNTANFKLLKMEIVCKNEEDNYFHLRPEATKDSVSKLLGMQDYKINEKWFDDQFLIQSNYEPFVTSILSEELLPIIHGAMMDLKGEIIMGNKVDMEKAVSLELQEGQTLDAHLLGEKTIAKRRIKGHDSQLTYISKHLKYTDDFDKIAVDIIMNIEMMVNLAERINKYNEMN